MSYKRHLGRTMGIALAGCLMHTAAYSATTPQEVAASLFSALHTERHVSEAMRDTFSHASRWYENVAAKAAAANGESPVSIACDLGGSVTITRISSVLIETLNAEYSSCTESRETFTRTANGPISVTRLRFGSQIILNLQLGVGMRALHEDISDAAEPSIQDVEATLLSFSGVLPQFDQTGPRPGSTYALNIDGYYSRLRHQAQEPQELIGNHDLRFSSAVANGVLGIGGYADVRPTSANYASGSIAVHKFDGSAFNVTWKFDRFSWTEETTRDGRVARTFDGVLHLTLPERASAGCHDGRFTYDTRLPLVTPGELSENFVGGRIRTNGGTITFTGSDPFALIAVPQMELTALTSADDFYWLANCLY